jgi:hypothetical protein
VKCWQVLYIIDLALAKANNVRHKIMQVRITSEMNVRFAIVPFDKQDTRAMPRLTVSRLFFYSGRMLIAHAQLLFLSNIAGALLVSSLLRLAH